MKLRLVQALGVTFALGSQAFGGDGTLPLGDGTLPLSLHGTAAQLDSSDGQTVSASTVFTFVEKKPLEGSDLECRHQSQGAQPYKAKGSIIVGSDRYAILAVCMASETSEIEVIAREQQATANSTMTGQLNQDHREQITRFDGRFITPQTRGHRYRMKLMDR